MQTISHDNINRFLERLRFEPADLFSEEKIKFNVWRGQWWDWVTRTWLWHFWKTYGEQEQ